MSVSKPAPSKPRPLFIYGTLRALPLLAWALTGDASNTSAVSKLVRPARIYGYARFSLDHCDYPAVIKHSPQSSVDGYLLMLETTSQRKKLDDFEGDTYTLESVDVMILDAAGNPQKEGETVEADIYLWAGDVNALTTSPWQLKSFEKQRLQDWLDLFEGVELVGEDEE
ncbi:AIG2-like protein [Xylaria cf. heliscus]|nr:AIG2-like protein [Xylaria cf. heliscus]